MEEYVIVKSVIKRTYSDLAITYSCIKILGKIVASYNENIRLEKLWR